MLPIFVVRRRVKINLSLCEIVLLLTDEERVGFVWAKMPGRSRQHIARRMIMRLFTTNPLIYLPRLESAVGVRSVLFDPEH